MRSTPAAWRSEIFGYPRHGVHINVRGQVFPKAWDVEETFGSVKGSAAVYLSPASEKTPTLALRAGGQKLFGPAIPTSRQRISAAGARGLRPRGGGRSGALPHRYAGDSSLYGSADLRIYVSRFRVDPAGDVGDPGFRRQRPRVAGRRGFEQVAHRLRRRAVVRLADRANAISALYARSEGRNAFYVHAGFAF